MMRNPLRTGASALAILIGTTLGSVAAAEPPPVRQWSSHLGGSGLDQAWDVAVGPDGGIYVAGLSDQAGNLPTAEVEARFGELGGMDVVVAKFSADGTSLLWKAVLGGGGRDFAYGIAVDAHGVVTIAGECHDDFPTTINTYAGTGQDAFVAQLDPALPPAEQLLLSIRIGGRRKDGCFGVMVHGGLVTVAGYTASPDFPATAGALQEEYQGGAYDLFIARFDPAAENDVLTYSTFVGSAGDDIEGELESYPYYLYSLHMAAGPDGTVLVGTECLSGGLPTTANAHQSFISSENLSDNYVIHLDPDAEGGAQLIYASYLGTPSWEENRGVAFDENGVILVLSYSWSASFPLTDNACDRTFGGPREGTLSRLDPELGLTYSTFLGGSGGEYNGELLVLPGNQVLVAGYTDSHDFPVTDGSTFNGGVSDIALTIVDLNDTSESFGQCTYSTYFGSSGRESFSGLELTFDGRILAVGETDSGRLGTDSAVQPATGGGRDMLIASFELRDPVVRFRRGDCNDDGNVDISDAVFSLGSLFLGEGTPGCDDGCDSNDDGAIDISDAIATLGVLFLGNGVIPLPGLTVCGEDPTGDQVSCTEYNGCP